MEDKFQKILKLVKGENGEEREGNTEENPNKEPLVELIEDFHKHYQSLYDRYDHLTGELQQKVNGKRKDSSSSSSSDSDSDDSPKRNSKNGKVKNEFQKVADETKEELETANLEIADLKNKLAVVIEEKEGLNLEYHAASLKIQEAEETIKKLKDDNSDILVTNRDLNVKLQSASEREAELYRKLEDVNSKMSTLILEKEDAMNTIEEEKKINNDLRAINAQLKDEKEGLELELHTVKGELSRMKDKLESAEKEVASLSQVQKANEEENNSLSSKVTELSEEIKQAHDKIQELVTESSKLREKFDDREREFLTHKEMHESHKSAAMERIRGLELDLDSLNSHKNEMEKQKDELSALLMKLENKERDLLSQVEILTTEKVMLSEEIKQAENKIQELVTECNQLREKLDDKEREYLTHKEMHESHRNEATARIRGFELELDSLNFHKSEMEKQKDEELSALLMKLEEKEKEFSSQVERLTADVNNLQREVESLHNQKGELEEQMEQKSNEALGQVKGLTDRLNEKERELESLQTQKIESEMQLEKKILEISEYLIQIESLKEELSNKTAGQMKLQEEKECYVILVKGLEDEKGGLQKRILELEGVLMEKENELSSVLMKFEVSEKEASSRFLTVTAEVSVLQEEINSLGAQKTELEFQLERKAEEISEYLISIEDLKKELASKIVNEQKMELEVESLQKKLEEVLNEASAQIESSTVHINNLQEELEFLRSEKSQLELLTEKVKQESVDSLTQVENQNTELASKISEQEEALNKLSEVNNQLEFSFEECKEKLQSAERKIEEMTEEFEKSTELNDRKFEELDEIIEDLKRELEMKGDEITTLTENVRNTEVKLRLSNQKLRVTEQLLSEKEDDHTAKEEKYQQDNKLLHERISVLSGVISTYKEAQFRLKSEITERVNETSTGFDTLTMKFEEDYGHIETCVYEILNELQVAKSWVRSKNVQEEKLNKEVSNLVDELKYEREKVGELMIKLQKNGNERENLAKGVERLEVKMDELKKVVNEKDKKMVELEKMLTEKDVWISGLGEEKKEAIKQLCIWIDYHRERCDHLKEILSKTAGGRRRQIAA